MFHDPKLELKHAATALRKRGIEVEIRAEGLLIQREDLPTIVVQLVKGREVQEAATAIGRGTEFAEPLALCDAQFEIGFLESNKLLEEGRTLESIREILQKLTHGYAYSTWDKRLSAPR